MIREKYLFLWVALILYVLLMLFVFFVSSNSISIKIRIREDNRKLHVKIQDHINSSIYFHCLFF